MDSKTDAFRQQVFLDFSDTVHFFLHSADRTTMESSLFDALRRTEVTLPAYTQLAPAFLRQIAQTVPAKTLGQSMRRLAGRPNLMHFGGVLWQCLLERERRLVLGQPLPSREDLNWLLDYVSEALAVARGDGSFYPCARTGYHMRTIGDDVLLPLLDQTHVLAGEQLTRTRRLVASLELYSFMMHGEHRDGIFDHGPYPCGPGKIAVIKDFTDLQNDYLPWATPEVRLPYPSISVVMVIDEACAPQFSWPGTMISLLEIYENIETAAVFSVVDDHIQLLPEDEFSPIERGARSALKSLFVKYAGWPEEQKVKYGYWLFSNHLQLIPRALNLDLSINDVMLETFKAGVDAEYELLDFSGPSPLWAQLRRPSPFTPLDKTP